LFLSKIFDQIAFYDSVHHVLGCRLTNLAMCQIFNMSMLYCVHHWYNII
jgi:hypothetical protein